jgi:hypothetical protein
VAWRTPKLSISKPLAFASSMGTNPYAIDLPMV